MLWVERTLVFEALPRLERAVQSESLAAAVAEHLEETRGHVDRVERAFSSLRIELSSARSAPFAALQADHDAVAPTVVEPRLRDLFHCGAAVATEHFELAAYENLLELARALGADDARALLDANRRNELETLDTLLRLGERLRGELPA